MHGIVLSIGWFVTGKKRAWGDLELSGEGKGFIALDGVLLVNQVVALRIEVWVVWLGPEGLWKI